MYTETGGLIQGGLAGFGAGSATEAPAPLSAAGDREPRRDAMDFDAPLPYGGDMQLAMKAADRPAIRRLMAERNAKERGFASAAEEAAANAPVVEAPPVEE